jgi:hypothetical protein
MHTPDRGNMRARLTAVIDVLLSLWRILVLNTLLKTVIWLLLGSAVVHADITVLLEEPYGTFGAMNPTGHAAVYLSGVCADTPVSLRRCHPGEIGAVISRYHRVGGYDWIAIPLIAYLYSVDDPNLVPPSANPDTVAELRDRYRRSYLESVAPDDSGAETPKGDWTQLVGEAYDRTIYAFRLETTENQDDALIRALNSDTNRTRFHLLYRNCADFVRQVVDFYYPNAVRRNFSADLGIMTPKQAAKRVMTYGRKRPELEFSLSVIPQVPGSIPRSSQVRDVLEFLIKSKKYVVPLALLSIVHPGVGGGLAYAWMEGSHFNPRRVARADGAPLLEPQMLVGPMRSPEGALQPAPEHP